MGLYGLGKVHFILWIPLRQDDVLLIEAGQVFLDCPCHSLTSMSMSAGLQCPELCWMWPLGFLLKEGCQAHGPADRNVFPQENSFLMFGWLEGLSHEDNKIQPGNQQITAETCFFNSEG